MRACEDPFPPSAPAHPATTGDPSDASPTAAPALALGDADARLERLGDRIAELSARIQAATYELLVLIREFDQQAGWDGRLSCAEWLSWRTGLAPGPAREHVRVARALGELPKLSDAMRRGRISYSKVRAITRVATPANEQTLLDVALAGTAEHVERIVRGWRRIDRTAEQAEEQRRDASRSLRTWVDDGGMVVVRGRLTPEVGAVLRRALDAACDAARRAPEPAGRPAAVASDEATAAEAAAGGGEQPTPAQRQADAIGVVAEAALAGGLDKGTAGDRYQVVLHVDAAALAEPRDVPAGTSAGAASEIEPQGGVRIPAGTLAGSTAGAERRARGGDVPAGTPAGSTVGSEPRGLGGEVPAGTPEGSVSGTGPRGRGGDVPAGTPGTASEALGRSGGGSPLGADAQCRTERSQPRRWRRTVGPCPGVRPAPLLAAAPAAPSVAAAPAAPSAGSQTVLDEAGGIHVSAETARRVACDAATVTMRHGPGGEILDVGRRTRTIPPALRRALAVRDRQCRFPGCGNRRTDAHHIQHWADGGRTALDNLVLLCRVTTGRCTRRASASRSTPPGTRTSCGRTGGRWRRLRRRRPGPGRRSARRTTGWRRPGSRSTRGRRRRPGRGSGWTWAGRSACCGPRGASGAQTDARAARGPAPRPAVARHRTGG